MALKVEEKGPQIKSWRNLQKLDKVRKQIDVSLPSVDLLVSLLQLSEP